jgi:hypothetical protein
MTQSLPDMPPPPVLPESSATIGYLGAEMRGASDGEGRVTYAAMEFLGALPPVGGRVLCAGPHEDALIDLLVAAGLSVDVQLRGPDDAEAASKRLPSSVRVCCGSLIRLNETYDAVIALGGLDRLASADAPVNEWTAALDRLTQLVGPGGLLAVVIRNGFGIDRLSSIGRPFDNLVDAFAAERPRAADRLTRAGFETFGEVALFPNTTAPTVLVTAGAFTIPDDTLATIVATAYRSAIGAGGTLIDPRRTARDSITHGLGLALAPGWLVVARRGVHDAISSPRAAAFVTDPVHPGYAAGPQRFWWDASGTWVRALLTDHDEPPGVAGTAETNDLVLRRLDRLDGIVPRGPLLEEQLITAAGGHDMLSLRQLLGAYARWLGVQTRWLDETDAAGDSATGDSAACAMDRVFAVADNVVVDDGFLRPFDPSWYAAEFVPANVAFIAALIRFADRLLASALPHPWVTAQSPVRLAVRLASMVGLTVPANVVDAATELAARTATLFDGERTLDDEGTGFDAEPPDGQPPTDPDMTSALSAEQFVQVPAQVGPVEPGGRLAIPPDLASARRTIDRLTTELAGSREQLGLLAATLHDRDKRLAKANRQLDVIKRSQAFRVASMTRKTVKAAVKALRRLRRRRGGHA